MTVPYSVEQYVSDLRRISAETNHENEIFDRIAPLAKQLASETHWLKSEYYTPDDESGFSAFMLHEEEDHSLTVLVASWVPGMGVVPHDHGTWAIVVGVEGVERNTRYKRLDDGSNPDFGELEVKDEFEAGPGDAICIRKGGIHSVNNDSGKVTISLHTYGMNINHTVRSQFDLETHVAKEFKVTLN